jgi:alkaline phosphatase
MRHPPALRLTSTSEEDRIAEQMVGDYPLGRVVDLMFGGGRCHFLPNSTVDSSCRADDRDIVDLAKNNGFNYISDRAGFDSLKGGASLDLPMLGLFAETDIPYEIDRRNENDIYPSLHEMAEAAMKALSDATRDSDKGFFLMIEGSRIDHAGHHNDPAAQVHEVLAYDRAFTSVLDFIKNEETQTVMVSTSDHETGGLAAARRMFCPPLW